MVKRRTRRKETAFFGIKVKKALKGVYYTINMLNNDHNKESKPHY